MSDAPRSALIVITSYSIHYTKLYDDPVDGIIGDTHAKFIARDANIPVFRFGFPVFDRVNLHRRPIVGYQGAINMLSEICNKFLNIVDETCGDRNFEMMR